MKSRIYSTCSSAVIPLSTQHMLGLFQGVCRRMSFWVCCDFSSGDHEAASIVEFTKGGREYWKCSPIGTELGVDELHSLILNFIYFLLSRKWHEKTIQIIRHRSTSRMQILLWFYKFSVNSFVISILMYVRTLKNHQIVQIRYKNVTWHTKL